MQKIKIEQLWDLYFFKFQVEFFYSNNLNYLTYIETKIYCTQTYLKMYEKLTVICCG